MTKLTLSFFFICFLTGEARSETVTFATDPWCPYVCDIQSDKPGILIEATSEILADTPYEPVFLTMNWARSIQNVRAGKINGLLSAYKTDAPDFIFTDPPFMLSAMCFFIPQDNDWHYTGTHSLSTRRIAIMNGYSYGEELDAYIANHEQMHSKSLIRVTGVDEKNRRIELIEKKRANTILEDRLVFLNLLKRSSSKVQFKEAGCIDGTGVHIGLSPNLDSSQPISALVSSRLTTLIETGKMQEIINRYIQ